MGIRGTASLNGGIESSIEERVTNFYYGLDAIGGLQWLYCLDRKVISVMMRKVVDRLKEIESVFLSPSGPCFGMKNVMIIW